MTDKRQQFEDRLVELGLQERVGGSSPPDLTQQILSRDAADKRAVTPRRDRATGVSSQLVQVSIAASLLITLVVIADKWPYHELAHHDSALLGGFDLDQFAIDNTASTKHSVAFPNASEAMPLSEREKNDGRPYRTLEDKFSRDTYSATGASLRQSIQSAERDRDVAFREVHSALAQEKTAASQDPQSANRDLNSAYEMFTRSQKLGPKNLLSLPPEIKTEVRRRLIELNERRALAQVNFAAAKQNTRISDATIRTAREDLLRAQAAYTNSVSELKLTEGKMQEMLVLLDRVEKGIADPRELNNIPGIERTPQNRFSEIIENQFESVKKEPVSTFSIDVDTASYSKVRNYLAQHGQLPPPGAVRIEELVNYFTYDYAPPKADDKHPFASHIEIAKCPWNDKHELVRIGIKGHEINPEKRPASNLVFLIDVSGSMNQPNKLTLVIEGMKMLVGQLDKNDRVAIVIYANETGVRLESTPGDQHIKIRDVLDQLRAQGSTNGGAGIHRAYQIALDNSIEDGVNRVILCTDGDFNVGTTGTENLVQLAEDHSKAGVYLSILGFGMDNHNDEMLEAVSNKANGNYAFIDNVLEARKVLVEQMSGTLVTIAKDVKIQVVFNPRRVASYRLIGYENRILAAKDFDDDKKDAGEIGAGHTVTALYEIEPADADAKQDDKKVDDRFLTLRLRYKQPKADKSTLIEFPSTDKSKRFTMASKDFQFTAAVASFGMLLRGSKHKGDTSFDAVQEIATGAKGDDKFGYRQEFIELIDRAKLLPAR